MTQNGVGFSFFFFSFCASYVLRNWAACPFPQQIERSLSHASFQELLLASLQELLLASCMSVLLGRHQRTNKASHVGSVLCVTSHWLPAVTVTDSCQVHIA